MPFLTEFSSTWQPKTETFILNRDLIYQGRDDLWTVPIGFITDLASIPRLFRSIISKIGRHLRAAVVHDWLYVEQPDGISRADADGVFRRIMREDEVGWFERWAMWSAVRSFGWIYWNRRRTP